MTTNAEPNMQTDTSATAAAAAPENVVATPADATKPVAGAGNAAQPDAAQPEAEGQQQQQEQTTVEPYEIKIPDFIPISAQTPEREAYVAEFASLAPQIGLSAGDAQEVLAMAVDAATVLDYQGGDEYTNADDAFTAMQQVFGDAAPSITKAAQKYATSLGPKFLEYLDRSNLGNDVATVTALALAGVGYHRLSPADAQTLIGELMQTKAYATGDKLAMLKLHALSRVAHREPSPAAPSRTPTPQQQAARGEAKETAQAEARAEAARLINEGALTDASHKDHAAALARWNAIVGLLG